MADETIKRIECFANLIDGLQLIKERLENKNCFLVGILNQLNQLVDSMEMIADVEVDSDLLMVNREKLEELIQEFQQQINNWPSQSRAENQQAIEALSSRVEVLRLAMQHAIERENELLANEGEDMEIDQIVVNNEVTISEQSTGQLPPTTVPTNENVEQPKLNEQFSQQVPAQESATKSVTQENSNANKLNDNANNQVKGMTPTSTEPLTKAMQATGEFTYQSLVMYNAAVNELLTIEDMPEHATAGNFRQLREFITRFVQMCDNMRIGILHIEPILIASVIASFNSETFNIWKFQMIKNKASLRTIREFLAAQEEAAQDKWFSESRFVLSRAIKSAQEMIKKKDQEKTKMNVNESCEKLGSEVKPTYSKMVQSKKGSEDDFWDEQSDANIGKTQESVPANVHQQKSTPNHSRSSSFSDPGSKGSGSKRNDQFTLVNKKKPNEKKQKTWICLGCSQNHPLFFCPRYLSMSLKERWDYIKRKNVCPLCLITRHSIMDCPDRVCGQCGDPHNSTLCEISVTKKQKPDKPKEERKRGG